MGTKKRNLGLRVLVIAAGLAIPAAAVAHVRAVSPAPRSQADNLKSGPCGNVPRTATPTVYAPGQTVTVKWTETIGHEGCYQVAFSKDDVSWTVLTQVADPAALQGMQMTTVTLPAGVSCLNCTLQVRQLMLENTANKVCAPDAAPPSAGGALGSTYYSCADICVGAGCPDASAPAVDSGMTSSSSGGPARTDSGVTTTPTDGGGKFVDGGDDDDNDPAARPNLRSGDGGGCSVALGATSGVSFVITLGILGLSLARRRRRAR